MNKRDLNPWSEVALGELNDFEARSINPAQFITEIFELYSVPSFPTGVPERVAGKAVGSSKQLVAPNDVLVCKINPRINRVWQVGPYSGQRQIASSEWIGVRAPQIDSRYLRYFFSSPEFRERLCTDLTGVGGSLTRAQPKNVSRFLVPVAPRNEQKRIADKLDTVLARVDACRERLDRVPAILKRFRQSVLAAATSGTLTEDWRAEGDIGFEWKDSNIQSVATVGTGSTPLRSNPGFYSKKGTPWITSAATSKAIVTSAGEYVTSAAISAHRLKIFPVGTLLVAMYGEGKTRGQVTVLGISAAINQACAAIVVDEEKALPGYVKLALQANYLEMRELAEGGNQPNLNLSKVKEFPFLLPTKDEQAEIIRRVKNLFDSADRIELYYSSACAQVEGLTPSLLAKAFRGELVPQDPSDEPADLLLARIHEAKTVAQSYSVKGKAHLKVKPTAAIINIQSPPSIVKGVGIVKNRKGLSASLLSDLLRKKGPLSAEVLWKESELDIDDFYDQLKDEEIRGFLVERRGKSPTEIRLLEAKS